MGVNGEFECEFCDMFELVHAFATGSENTTSIQALFNRLKPVKF